MVALLCRLVDSLRVLVARTYGFPADLERGSF
jgi:hypothetical protein